MFKKLVISMAAACLLAACESPPPTPTAPPPPPTKVSYMTFFDWGSVKLNEQAMNTIGQAATAYKAKPGPVMVTGYADTTGDAASNKRLSQRRADAVKKGLVDAGIPDTAITTSASGDTGLLVDTGPQSKEARNRRVVINVGS